MSGIPTVYGEQVSADQVITRGGQTRAFTDEPFEYLLNLIQVIILGGIIQRTEPGKNSFVFDQLTFYQQGT